jgi:VanZ family protein
MTDVFSKRAFFRWMPAMIVMGVIFFASSLPAEDIPQYGIFDFFIKKGGHALGYGLLGLSYFFALPTRLSKRYRGLLAFIMAVLFALSDEYHQSFVSGRNARITDVVIDGIGAGLALFFGGNYVSNSRSNSKS